MICRNQMTSSAFEFSATLTVLLADRRCRSYSSNVDSTRMRAMTERDIKLSWIESSIDTTSVRAREVETSRSYIRSFNIKEFDSRGIKCFAYIRVVILMTFMVRNDSDVSVFNDLAQIERWERSHSSSRMLTHCRVRNFHQSLLVLLSKTARPQSCLPLSLIRYASKYSMSSFHDIVQSCSRIDALQETRRQRTSSRRDSASQTSHWCRCAFSWRKDALGKCDSILRYQAKLSLVRARRLDAR